MVYKSMADILRPVYSFKASEDGFSRRRPPQEMAGGAFPRD